MNKKDHNYNIQVTGFEAVLLKHRLLYLKVKNQVGAFMLSKAGKPLFATSMFLHKHKMNTLAIGLLDLHIQLFTKPGCKIIDDVKLELDEIEKIIEGEI